MDKFVTIAARPEPDMGNKAKRRKYDENCINLGFIWTGSTDIPRPQCVICKEVLANDSLRSLSYAGILQQSTASLLKNPRVLSNFRGYKEKKE